MGFRCTKQETGRGKGGIPETINDSLSVERLEEMLSNMALPIQDSLILQQMVYLDKINRFTEIQGLYQVLEKKRNLKEIPLDIRLLHAKSHLGNQHYAQAWSLLSQLKNEAEQREIPADIAKVYNNIARYYEALNQLPEAVDYFYKSMDAFEGAGMTNEFYLTQIELATVFFFLKDYQKSLGLHKKAYSYFNTVKDTAQMAYISDGITVAYDNLDSLALAQIHGKFSLDLYQKSGDKRGMSVALNNLAHLSKRQKDLPQAEQYLREGLALMEESRDSRYIPVCLSNLGNCLLEMNKLDEAESLLLRAEERISAYPALREKANIKLALAKLYEKRGFTSKALQYRIAHSGLVDSLNNKERMRILSEAATKYENKVRESEIERLKYQNEISETKQLTILLCSLAILLISLSWLISKHRRAKALLEKEKELLAERSRTQEAELNLARSEIESFADKAHEYTRLLNELQAKYESNPESFSSPEETYQFITQLYHQRILTEEDWERFKEQFDKVYPGFGSKLKLTFPDISQAELRLALLLKLNLETREISSTLGVSPDTVKKTRQRLRKRVGLGEEEKLEDWIRNQ